MCVKVEKAYRGTPSAPIMLRADEPAKRVRKRARRACGARGQPPYWERRAHIRATPWAPPNFGSTSVMHCEMIAVCPMFPKNAAHGADRNFAADSEQSFAGELKRKANARRALRRQARAARVGGGYHIVARNCAGNYSVIWATLRRRHGRCRARKVADQPRARVCERAAATPVARSIPPKLIISSSADYAPNANSERRISRGN